MIGKILYCNIIVFIFYAVSVQGSEIDKDMFEKIFQYELNNRASAFLSVPRIAQKMKNTQQFDFWKAYTRLEQHSQPQYELMSKKYGLGVNSIVAKLKAWSFGLGFQLFNKTMLSVMSKATNDYVKKLEPLPELARAEDRTFFEYVIAQEQAQAIALKHADAGNFYLGTAVLNDFLAEQEENQSAVQ